MAWVLTSNNFDVWLAYDLSDINLSDFNNDLSDTTWDHGGLLGLTDDDHTQYLIGGSLRTGTSLSGFTGTYPIWRLTDTDYTNTIELAVETLGYLRTTTATSLAIQVGGTNYLVLATGGNIDVVNSQIVLDEDTLVSNSDTQLATQQSIKAYVDAAVAAVAGGLPADPGYDAVVIWDDSASTYLAVAIGIGIQISGTDFRLATFYNTNWTLGDDAVSSSIGVTRFLAVSHSNYSGIVFDANSTTGYQVNLWYSPTEHLWQAYSSGDGGAAKYIFSFNTTTGLLNTMATNPWVVDEDTMVSNSNVRVPTQQSVKAYVDAQVAAGLTTPLLKGAIPCRIHATWVNATSFTITGGCYHHDGTTEQMVFWDSTFTITASAVGAGNYYLYIDDSSVAAGGKGGTTPLVSTNFLWTSTAPTFSTSKGGWYSGNDRCIYMSYQSGANALLKFHHDGGSRVEWDSRWTTVSSYDFDTTWVDVGTAVPAGWKAIMSVSRDSRVTDNNEYDLYARPNGSSATVGHKIAYDRDHVSYVGSIMVNEFIMQGGTTGYIEVKAEAANALTWTIDIHGFLLPGGM